MAKTRRRNSKGRFVKGGGSTVIARRGPTKVVVVRRGPTAVARRAAPSPRRRSSGGTVGTIARYFGAPRTDDVVASAGLGLVIANTTGRGYVEALYDKAPEALQKIGAFGVLAIASGLANHYGLMRSITGPVARVSTYLATYHLARRGGLYEATNGKQQLQGDDDDSASGDDWDTSGLDDDVGDDDVGDDDVGDDDDF